MCRLSRFPLATELPVNDLGVVLGVPDQIFATVTQYAFLAAIAAVSMTATVSAVILQRQRP